MNYKQTYIGHYISNNQRRTMHCNPTTSIKRGLVKMLAVLSSREKMLTVANGKQTMAGEHKLDLLRDTSKWTVHSIKLLQ